MNLIKTQSDLKSAISKMERALEAKAENEKRKGSGWVFDKISSM